MTDDQSLQHRLDELMELEEDWYNGRIHPSGGKR
jgi:hypothetical protein